MSAPEMNKLSVIYNLPISEYHNGQPYSGYLSSSQLKFYAKSPRYARYMIDNPQPQTEAMKFGDIFHDLMASLSTHDADWGKALLAWDDNLVFFIPPLNAKGKPFSPASNAYKEAYEKLIQSSGGRTIISERDYDLAISMARSLLNDCGSTSERVYELLRWGKPEVSHFVEYEGLKFKYRPDLETPRKIVDYKSVVTDDLSEKSISSIIVKYGYDISAAFYQFMEHEQSGIWKTFYWLFVSKQPPHDAVLVDASKWTYEYDPESEMMIPQVGAIKMRWLLDRHIKCTKEDNWPGAEINIPKDEYGNRIMKPTPSLWEINRASEIIELTFNI